MRQRHCGMSGTVIKPDARVVLITSKDSSAGPFHVWVLEAIFFNWFANRFLETLPGLRPMKLPDCPRIAWVFDPVKFSARVAGIGSKTLIQLLDVWNPPMEPITVCPIPVPAEPISLDIRWYV